MKSTTSEPGLHIKQEALPGGLPVLKLRGSIDAEGAPILSDAIESLLGGGQSHMLLDFELVRFISSTGIGCLVAAVSECRDEGGDLVLTNLNAPLREVFEALDLMDYVTIGEAK